MSYYFDFSGRKAAVLARIDELAQQPYIGEAVGALVKSAINNVVIPEGQDVLFVVHGDGHHVTDPGFGNTIHNIRVHPITVLPDPAN